MKAIMIKVSPDEAVNLLNGDLSVLVRKKFPVDYVGWVYIYCTKGKPSVNIYRAIGIKENVYKAICSLNECQVGGDLDNFMNVEFIKKYPQYDGKRITFRPTNLNGKVVARFWCDMVDFVSCEAYENGCGGYNFDYYCPFSGNLEKESCLNEYDLRRYLGIGKDGKPLGTAIHITKLEIFDKPKEISEFYHHFTQKRCERTFSNNTIEIDDKTHGLRQPTKGGYEYVYPLTRAPRSWGYIEI